MAATSQISALLIPLDFMASKSLVIEVAVIFPFNQHQKAPGRYDKGGFTNSSESFCEISTVPNDLFFGPMEIE
jgi:hypothetical protein